VHEEPEGGEEEEGSGLGDFILSSGRDSLAAWNGGQRRRITRVTAPACRGPRRKPAQRSPRDLPKNKNNLNVIFWLIGFLRQSFATDYIRCGRVITVCNTHHSNIQVSTQLLPLGLVLNLRFIRKIFQSSSPPRSSHSPSKMPTLPKSPALTAIAEIILQADQATRSQSPCKPSRLQRFSSTISGNGLSSPHSPCFYSSSSESINKPHACPVTPQLVSTTDSTSLLRFPLVDPPPHVISVEAHKSAPAPISGPEHLLHRTVLRRHQFAPPR